MKHFLLNTTGLTIVFALFVLIFITGCEKDEDAAPDAPTEKVDGIFIINEGAFLNENSSLSYIDKTTGEINNNVFYEANNRPLGDVFQSMKIFNEKAYMVINNSGVIEVIHPETIELITTITGFTSPRYFLPVNETTAYVSDLFAEKIWVVNLSNNSIESEIEFPGGWSESMIKAEGNVFVSAPNANNIYVIDPSSHEIIDNIEVFSQPNSMVTDNNGTIWVLSGGTWDWETGEQVETGGITAINSQTREVNETYSFPQDGISYSKLTINKTSEKLFYIGGGIWSMDITNPELTTEPLIENTGENFYGLGVCPETGNIYVSDAIDFNQRGKIMQFSSQGNKIESFDAGVVPAGFVFQ